MTPYTPIIRRSDGCPSDIHDQIQARANAYYKDVSTEIAKDERGFFLKAYVKGEYVGGLQQLPEAMISHG